MPKPMKNRFMKLSRLFFSVCIATMILASCSAPKNVTYFQDLDNGTTGYVKSLNYITVKPEDKLSIIITSKNPELTELFNLTVVNHRAGALTSGNAIGSNSYISYYTVDSKGDIDFPILGNLHVEGMNREGVSKYIKDELISKQLLKDAVVTVEYANTGFTILGEVNKPGRIEINRDRLTLPEALGMAGDLTIQGERENVLVIREIDGKPTAFRVDLTNAQSMMESPVYYIQQNDQIYVTPNSKRKRDSTVNGNNVLSASFWVSVASLLTSVAVLIVK